MTMREYTILPLALALIAMVSGYNPKKDSPKSATAVASSDASAVASDGGIFKYTITTDFDVGGDEIEILVAINSVSWQYPVKYDLDCEGDGEFEKVGLTYDVKCVYKKNTGKHQIWVRGEIPAMFLCAERRKDIDRLHHV